MSDYSELKRLASAARNWGGEIGEDRWHEAGCFKHPGFSVPDAEFLAGCEPGAVLALIAEIERLRIDAADVNWMVEQRDQLKSEVETLASQVKALQSDANSYQSGYDAGRAAAKAHADSWRAEAEALRKERDKLAEDKRGLLEDFGGLL